MNNAANRINATYINNIRAKIRNICFKVTPKMLVCVLLIGCFVSYANPQIVIWDSSFESDFNSIDFYGKFEEIRMSNAYLIFPGTKWCGPGNISSNYEDLGEQRDTDKCCRTHDSCPDVIEAHQSKYNLNNTSFYTRLACYCDEDFYKCLKTINTKTSMGVGQLYFTLLGTSCYKNDYPIKGCKVQTLFPRQKCVEYELDTSKEKVYQWFDVKNF